MSEPAREVVLATRSEGKRRELAPLLAAAGWHARTLDEVGVPEDAVESSIEAFDTFEENVSAKAAWFFARCGGRPVLADDSGLVVPALGGRPGVHSKWFAGRRDLTGASLDAANNAALVSAVAPLADRRAHYVCVMAWRDGLGTRLARGETHGVLRPMAAGSGGFGYDPYFVSDELGMTFAEATREQKASVSHRGRALRRLLASVG